MTPSPTPDPARGRFLAVQLTRLAGLVLIGAGLLVWVTDLVEPGGLPALGIPLVLIGLAESIVLPLVLVRRWRTPPNDTTS